MADAKPSRPEKVEAKASEKADAYPENAQWEKKTEKVDGVTRTFVEQERNGRVVRNFID